MNKLNFNKNIKAALTALVYFSSFGCSSPNDVSKPVVQKVKDLTGIYRTNGDLSDVSSITAIEIFNGSSESELTVDIIRNGLSFEEKTYFNNLNEIYFADNNFGLTLNLTLSKEGEVRNSLIGNKSFVHVCGKKTSLGQKSMDFQYCLAFTREVNSLIARGDLILNVYELGKKTSEIKTSFEVFMKDRWFVDYFGEWTGELSYINGNSYGLNLETGKKLDITFQPVSKNSYILRPLDNNQTIMLADEVFVLQPLTRPMSELEENANPYIDFIYVSTRNGNRKIYFNSFVHSQGYIEGSILLNVGNSRSLTIGTYSLDQVQ